MDNDDKHLNSNLLVAVDTSDAEDMDSSDRLLGSNMSNAISKKSAELTFENKMGKNRIGKLQQLQQLSQPYFLPLGPYKGWLFIWLLISLILCVTGIALLLLTGVVWLAFAVSPDKAERVLSSPRAVVQTTWSGDWGAVIMVLTMVGAGSFFMCRRKLHGKWMQWILLGLILLVLLLVNGINTGIGFVAKYMTDAMIHKEADTFYQWLTIYASCFVVALPILTAQYYVKARLGLLWREWLSVTLISGWMSHRAYYVLNPNDEEAAAGGVDNPDQRIAQDVDTFTTMTLEYLVGTIDATMTFFLNILVLWSINHELTIVLLFWSLGMTAVLLVFSRNLVKVNYSQLKYEADFRYGLVHVRDNSESIAFYGGEAAEKHETVCRLSTVVANYTRLILWQVLISVLRRMYTYGNVFVPYVVMAPFIMSGHLTYGDFSQANFTFRLVEDSLSFIAQSLEGMTAWVAGISRLEGFQSAVAEVAGNQSELTSWQGSAIIIVCDAELRTPGSEQLLVTGLTLSVSQGEQVLVVGPSGCGKTSVLRMISGLWQPSAGQVKTPLVGKLLFVPQKPYMILGSLREQLCYPHDESAFGDEELRKVLVEVSLGHFLERYPDLGITQDWSRLLSLGEQQRLAFARVLLSAPEYAVLDEATSALDVRTERHLYRILQQRGTAYISVGHRPTLLDYHQNILELQGGPQGGWRLLPAAGYNFHSV